MIFVFVFVVQVVTGLVIYPLAIFPGLMGNTLTIFVMSRRNMQTSTNAFLSALAVSDSIKLINDMLYFFVTVFLRTSPGLGILAYGYLYPYAHFIFSMSVCVSSWLTVSVAVERYILVCHPTRARALWNRKRAVMLCSFIYIVMTSLAFPSALRYRTIRCLDSKTNMSRLDVEVTEIWQNQLLITAYDWAQNLIRSIIPLLLLVVLNACIISALRRTKGKRRKNSRHRVTIMMIVVILVFLVCITPDAILSTVFGFGYHEAGYLGKGIREITDSLLTVNAGINFLIYCAFNQVFRKSFTSICCPKKTQTSWTTELDESTYRKLSEAKSLLSSNNNSPPRQETQSTVTADISFNGNVYSLATEGGASDLISPAMVTDLTNPILKHSKTGQVRPLSLTCLSPVIDSHHHHRVSSSGLKKSKNSIKCNRNRSKASVTFSDSVAASDRMKMKDESSNDSYTLDQDVQTKNRSALKNAGYNIFHNNAHLESGSSVQCSVGSLDSVYSFSEDTSHSKIKDVNISCDADAQTLAKFRICDGTQVLGSHVLSDARRDFSDASATIQDNDYTTCKADSMKCSKKNECLFHSQQNATTTNGHCLDKSHRDQMERSIDVSCFSQDACGHTLLSNRADNVMNTNSPDVRIIHEGIRKDWDYVRTYYLPSDVLTSDV